MLFEKNSIIHGMPIVYNTVHTLLAICERFTMQSFVGIRGFNVISLTINPRLKVYLFIN